jgi:hypothetical protein
MHVINAAVIGVKLNAKMKIKFNEYGNILASKYSYQCAKPWGWLKRGGT